MESLDSNPPASTSQTHLKTQHNCNFEATMRHCSKKSMENKNWDSRLYSLGLKVLHRGWMKDDSHGLMSHGLMSKVSFHGHL